MSICFVKIFDFPFKNNTQTFKENSTCLMLSKTKQKQPSSQDWGEKYFSIRVFVTWEEKGCVEGTGSGHYGVLLLVCNLQNGYYKSLHTSEKLGWFKLQSTQSRTLRRRHLSQGQSTFSSVLYTPWQLKEDADVKWPQIHVQCEQTLHVSDPIRGCYLHSS